ncbi:FIMAH domain-containing protein [Micromonospora sp. GCM10011542]|uniref:FIMAH domain-containing protein n=1 Tax=Micromonospora sp. GCM10011542 TaxID=3317337 RepID=UPI00361D6471
MSAPHDPRSADVAPPTSMLPLVRPAGSRHRAPDDGRRLMWLTVGGAAVALVAAMVTVTVGGDGDAGPAAASTVAVGTSAPAEPTEAPTGDVTPPPTPTPSPSLSPSSSTPRRAANPGELVAGLQATVDGLAQQRQLRPGDGKELRKRLRQVAEEIADGETERAREKLREFAEKLASLLRDGKISANAHEVLLAGATQVAQALPGR